MTVSWGSLLGGGESDEVHQLTFERVLGAMETGHHAKAREILEEYSLENPQRAESMRLSLIRRYGTGL